MESEYTKYFDSIAKECDMSEISEHSLGAIFWDKQQQKIDKALVFLEGVKFTGSKCDTGECSIHIHWDNIERIKKLLKTL